MVDRSFSAEASTFAKASADRSEDKREKASRLRQGFHLYQDYTGQDRVQGGQEGKDGRQRSAIRYQKSAGKKYKRTEVGHQKTVDG
jgi:hypothetical protein